MKPVHIVGAGGYAAVLINVAERCASEGLCSLGTVAIDPRYTPRDLFESAVVQHRARGWRVVQSFHELVEDAGGPDSTSRGLVLLPVPIHLHAPMAVAAMDAGLDVLCEKPLAGSRSDVEALRSAARRAPGRVLVGFQHILSRSIQTLLAVVAGGEIGAVTEIRGSVIWPRTERYFSRSGWSGKLRVDGRTVLDCPIHNAGAHVLHAMLEIAARAGWMPRTVTAEHARLNDIETADTQILRVSTGPAGTADAAGPTISYVAMHACTPQRDPRIEVIGTTGRLVWSFPDTLDQYHHDATATRRVTPRVDDSFNALALRHALTASDQLDPGVSLDSAERHLAVVHAAFGGEEAPGFPFAPIPASFHRAQTLDGNRLRTLVDGEVDARKLIDTARLPTELDVPWAPYVHRVVDAPVVLSQETQSRTFKR